MSSHHIVREGQEPALLIAEPVSFERVQPLLEWAPLIIILHPALENTLSWGIKADVVVTGVENVNEVSEKVVNQMPIKILSCSPSEDPLEKAFDFLLGSGQIHATVLVDKIEAYLEKTEYFGNRLKIAVVDEKIRWSCIASGVFKKWFPSQTKLFFRSKSTNLVSEGPLLRLEDHFFVTDDGFAIFRSSHNFWIGEIL